VRVVEADVRLFHGRLEIRHLKTLGPVPILWDRWRLANPFRRRLRLRELLATLGPETELLLDVKGARTRITTLVRAELEAHRGRVILCARSRRVFEALRAEPGPPVVRSVGSHRQLRSVLLGNDRLDGISIHARLVDATVVSELRRVTGFILTWPVRSIEQARLLVSSGSTGSSLSDSSFRRPWTSS